MSTKGRSRRSFLVNSVTGLNAAWVAANYPGILAAQEYVRQASQAGQLPRLAFFNEPQAAEIEAMAARIIPTDETPGAREAGCLYFIDRALTTFDKQRQPVYTAGLGSLQDKTRELFPDASKFSGLNSAQQIQVLKAIETTPFFMLVRTHTITGFLANPEHGGNQNQAGWKLIGFEGKFRYESPFGYYDRESKSASLTTGKG
jgi:gluconate 2-dehydrogenase gamma chain